MEKHKILIVDDSDFNREILKDMLSDEYDILEAANGEDCVALLHQYKFQITALLLDVIMPKMDGLEVLAVMNKNQMIKYIPVIMISSEDSSHVIDRAYDLGAYEYISRPYNENIVRRRVNVAINMFKKQKELVNVATTQMLDYYKHNAMLINILSEIVEFRNGESGLHILHINKLTEIFLNYLHKLPNNPFDLDAKKINLISIASSMHDIGKMGIPEEILNKPGKLTSEEFEIMKTHSQLGADMISRVKQQTEADLITYCYEICRYHHERYDGRGYPTGLSGNDIPISAQVVSLADVYDALTAERCYKKAFSHETAISMIVNNECGVFNPVLIKALLECQNEIKECIEVKSYTDNSRNKIEDIVIASIDSKTTTDFHYSHEMYNTILDKLEFIVDATNIVMFDYEANEDTMYVYGVNLEKYGLKKFYSKPYENKEFREIIQAEGFEREDTEKNGYYSITINGVEYMMKSRSRYDSDGRYLGIQSIVNLGD